MEGAFGSYQRLNSSSEGHTLLCVKPTEYPPDTDAGYPFGWRLENNSGCRLIPIKTSSRDAHTSQIFEWPPCHQPKGYYILLNRKRSRRHHNLFTSEGSADSTTMLDVDSKPDDAPKSVRRLLMLYPRFGRSSTEG